MPLSPPLPFSFSLSLLSCHSDIFWLVAKAIVAVLCRSLLLLLLSRRHSEGLLDSVMFVGLQRHPEQSQLLQYLGWQLNNKDGTTPSLGGLMEAEQLELNAWRGQLITSDFNGGTGEGSGWNKSQRSSHWSRYDKETIKGHWVQLRKLNLKRITFLSPLMSLPKKKKRWKWPQFHFRHTDPDSGRKGDVPLCPRDTVMT